MEEDFNLDLYRAIEENSKIFNPTKVTKEDLKRALNVAREIIKLHKKETIPRTKPIPFNVLLVKSLNNLYSLGLHNIVSDATSIIKYLEYYELENQPYSSFVTNSSVIDTGCGYAKKAVSIYVPSYINEASSIFMSHEVIHILKERNPEECKCLNTTGEVLPMLVELLHAYNSNPTLLKEIIYERIKLLYYEAKQFLHLYETIKGTKNPNLLPALYSSCNYLNSFYYTLILFKLSFNNEDYVIDLLNNSVNNQISTSTITNELEESPDSNTLYQEGFNIIKKALK